MADKFGSTIDGCNWANDRGGLTEIHRQWNGDDQEVVFHWANGDVFTIGLVALQDFKKFKAKILNDLSMVTYPLMGEQSWANIVPEVIRYAPEIEDVDRSLDMLLEIMESFVGGAATRAAASKTAAGYDENAAVDAGITRYQRVEGGIIFRLVDLEAFCKERGYAITRRRLTNLLQEGGGTKAGREGGRHSRLWYWPENSSGASLSGSESGFS